MWRKEEIDPWDKRGGPVNGQSEPSRDCHKDHLEDELLPTITLIQVPHPQIPDLFQYCFEYVERWQWSAETELVETGRWFFGRRWDGV